MAVSPILIGDMPNDKLGDPVRIAFQKVNGNFSSVEAAIAAVETLATGPMGPLGPVGPVGATGPVGEGTGGLFFTSLAAAKLFDFPAAIKVVRTAGFADFGDLGHGMYYRRATAPKDPTNPGYFRSLDRYMRNGATDSNSWWLVAAGGPRTDPVGVLRCQTGLLPARYYGRHPG